MCCSRAVGSRQSSPTDTNTQAASRLADNMLLSHHQLQQSVQLQQQSMTGGQFEVPSSASAAAAGLNDAFFTPQYMMDSAQQADYNQQVSGCLSLSFSLSLSERIVY